MTEAESNRVLDIFAQISREERKKSEDYLRHFSAAVDAQLTRLQEIERRCEEVKEVLQSKIWRELRRKD